MMHPKQKSVFQLMKPDQKIQVALRIYHSARELKAAGLRIKYPDMTEDQIQNKVREVFLYART